MAVMQVLFSTERFDVVERKRGHEAAMPAIDSDAEAMRYVGAGEPLLDRVSIDLIPVRRRVGLRARGASTRIHAPEFSKAGR